MPSAQAQADVEKVLEALRRAIRREGMTLRQVEQALGRKGDYLRQVMSGKIELRWEHIVGILAAVGVHPVDFFEEVYGLPSDRPAPPTVESLYELSSQLVRWSSLRVLIWEFKEKGVFSEQEAESLIARMESEAPPLGETGAGEAPPLAKTGA